MPKKFSKKVEVRGGIRKFKFGAINGEKMVFYRDVLLYLQLADPTETMQVVYERDGAQYETELHFQYD